VPNLKNNLNWDVEGENLKENIINELEKTIMPDLNKYITDVSYMTPKSFKTNYRSMWGAGFSIAPKFYQSAWFRYHNQDPKIKNIFFSAAGAHPGAGIPGVLSSAKVVETILKDQEIRY
jgi:phytoene desaturase